MNVTDHHETFSFFKIAPRREGYFTLCWTETDLLVSDMEQSTV